MVRKHKLELRNEVYIKDFSHKLPENYDNEDLAVAMEGADWSDDPGTGRSVHTHDGREILNPLPVAPPASIAAAAAEPSVNDLVERALKRHFEMLKGDDEVDTAEDADDFGEDDELTPFSQFEIVMRDEAPAIPKEPVSDDAIAEVRKVEDNLPPVKPDTPEA